MEHEPSDNPKQILRDSIEHVIPSLLVLDSVGRYPISSIGSVASCLAVLDSSERGIKFATDTIDKLEIEEPDQYEIWRQLAAVGVAEALDNARASVGIHKSGDEYSLAPGVDIDRFRWRRMGELAMLDDDGIIPFAHELISKVPDDDKAILRVTTAIGPLYEAGDDTAVDLAVQTARRAFKYTLEHLPEDSNISAANVDDFNVAVQGLGRALFPILNDVEKLYANTDTALYGIALTALSKNRLEDFAKIRAEIHSIRLGAQLDAKCYAEGKDPEGTYLEAAVTAAGIYGDDLGLEATRAITDTLVGGGDPELTHQYTATFLEGNMAPEDIPVGSLAALAKGGNDTAKELLQSAAKHTNKQAYVKALVGAGMKTEAAAFAKQLYATSKTRAHAIILLQTEFSVPAWQEMMELPLEHLPPDDPGASERVEDILMLAKYVTKRNDLLSLN